MSDRSSNSLRHAAAAGARWTFTSTGVVVITHLVQLTVLARVLDPQDFGLAAAAMLVVGLAGRIGDAGINNGIIARQTTDPHILSSLYWANVIVGVIVAGLVVLSIPLATAYFDNEALGPLLLLAAPASIIVPIGQQYQAILQKELRFRPLAAVEAAAALAGTSVAIGLALKGAGAAAFIGGYLVQSTVKALWLAVRGWSTARPSLRLRRADLRGYLSFGMYQLGERITNYLGSNLDYALIGGFLGTRTLGVYSVAFRLVTLPQMRLNPILTRVAFPVFARRQNDNPAMRRGYLELSRLIAFVSFPLMAGMAATAPQLVPVVFGSQWQASVPILQVLALAGIVFSLANPNGSVFLAKNRPDLGFKVNLLRLALLVAALVPAVQVSALAVAWAFVAVVFLMFFVTRLVLTKLIGLTLGEYLSALRPPAISTLIMVACLLAASSALSPMLASDAWLLVVQVIVGILSYGICTWLLERKWIAQTWRLVTGSGSAPPPQPA